MYQFEVPKMACGHCAGAVKNVIKRVDSAASTEFDLSNRKVTVGTSVSPEALVAALTSAGYPATFRELLA